MASPELNAEVLLNLGFVDVGHWRPIGDFIMYELDGNDTRANEVLLDDKNALYAFVKIDQVLYIGKTARSIRKRYVGYCRRESGRQPTSAAIAISNQRSPAVKKSESLCSIRHPISSMAISRSIWLQAWKTT